MNQAATGQDIDARCGKCKLVLAHVIVAMGQDSVAQVQCKTCNAVHKYRSPKIAAPKKKAAAGTRARKSAAKPAITALSPEEIAGADIYAPTSTFIEGQVLRHLRFGAGRVEAAGNTKIEVAFLEQRRVLIHNRPAPESASSTS